MDNGYFTGYSESCQHQEEQPINNIEYSTNGEFFTYTTGGLLKVYETKKYSLRNIISMDISHSKFFQKHTMIQSSKNLLFHHSIYDNKLLQRFDHGGDIEHISVNPFYDTFMSVGSSKVNLWDIRMERPLQQLDAPGYIGALSFDNRYCLCFNGQVKIFDMREDHGPMITALAPSAFYDSIWFTRDTSTIIIASKNTYACVDASGQTKGVVTLESASSGDTSSDGTILVCSAKKYIMGYRVNDRVKCGALSTGYELCTALRLSPSSPQILCVSGCLLKIYDQES